MKLSSSTARPASAGATRRRAMLAIPALALVALFALAVPLVRAQDDPVVARVNGTEIKQSDLAIAEEEVGSQVAQMAPEAKREYLISFIADMMLAK